MVNHRSFRIKIKSEKNYITLYLIGAELQVTVKLHEKFLLTCTASSDPENVKHIGWYRCSSSDCEHDWDKFLIAHVQNVTETIADNPNFEVLVVAFIVYGFQY